MKRKDGSMFVGKFANGKGKAAQNDLMTLLAPHRPDKPLQGAVALEVTWRYPWRKSERKANIALGVIPCTTRPDCDNLCKMLMDCMTRLAYWTDDGQVAELTIRKQWGSSPGIGITTFEIDSTETRITRF
jgi:Holliday junction resolvase RusA-like endonuclease